MGPAPGVSAAVSRVVDVGRLAYGTDDACPTVVARRLKFYVETVIINTIPAVVMQRGFIRGLPFQLRAIRKMVNCKVVRDLSHPNQAEMRREETYVRSPW